jgi:SAM-dependent methyltransferase
MLPDGKRIADEAVYLDKSRSLEPKEAFKLLGELILQAQHPASASLLDVGCATGDLLLYFKNNLPGFDYLEGVDLLEKLINQARKRIPGVEFRIGSALDPECFLQRKFDVVVCCGTVQIFDDLKLPLENFLSCARKNASILICSPFNEEPIDVITRYRRAGGETSDWELGWNIFSCKTVDNILEQSGYDLSWSWHPFDMPFAIPKRDDPMRTWTIKTEKKPFQTINGASQLINLKVVNIRVNGLRE